MVEELTVAPVTDPAVLEDINAAFALAVYEASCRRARQLAGVDPPPPPCRESRALLRRLQVRPATSVCRSGTARSDRAAAPGA